MSFPLVVWHGHAYRSRSLVPGVILRAYGNNELPSDFVTSISRRWKFNGECLASIGGLPTV